MNQVQAAPPRDPGAAAAESYLHQLLHARAEDTAQRAAVSRGIRPETEVAAYPFCAHVLQAMPERQQVGALRVFGMAASFRHLEHVRSGYNDDGVWVNTRVGQVLGRAFRHEGKLDEGIGVRLSVLPGLDVEGAAEVLAGLLHRLDNEGRRAIDWVNLLRLLMHWKPQSRRASEPAFDYYASSVFPATSATNEKE